MGVSVVPAQPFVPPEGPALNAGSLVAPASLPMKIVSAAPAEAPVMDVEPLKMVGWWAAGLPVVVTVPAPALPFDAAVIRPC